MNAIEETILQLNKIKANARNIAIDEFKKEANLMSELNRKQLLSGKDAFGNSTPPYAKSSKKTGAMKYFDEGDYQAGIHPMFSTKGFDMTSSDFKVRFLDPYRGVVQTLGLDDNSLAIVLNKSFARAYKRIFAL